MSMIHDIIPALIYLACLALIAAPWLILSRKFRSR